MTEWAPTRHPFNYTDNELRQTPIYSQIVEAMTVKIGNKKIPVDERIVLDSARQAILPMWEAVQRKKAEAKMAASEGEGVITMTLDDGFRFNITAVTDYDDLESDFAKKETKLRNHHLMSFTLATGEDKAKLMLAELQKVAPEMLEAVKQLYAYPMSPARMKGLSKQEKLWNACQKRIGVKNT